MNTKKTTYEALKQRALHIPHIRLTKRQLSDLELILNGGFAPLTGFMTEDEYKSVVDNARLPNGSVWPMPVVLDVPENHTYTEGQEVALCDAYGNLLALMLVESVFVPDKEHEVKQVYGTDDESHFGVSYILSETHPVYIGGIIERIAIPSHELFQSLYKTPEEIHEYKLQNNIDTLVGFQTRNPLHRAHFEVIKRASEEHGGTVLIHPAVGETKTGDIDAITRVRAYQHVHEKYAPEFTMLSLLPLAMRMGGPREALWHALIRKNYGCTHFIIGRDHAGPGKDSNGNPFYGLYDAQEYVQQFADEIGIKVISAPELFYDGHTKQYISTHEQTENSKPLYISGTEFRNKLAKNEQIPEWFSFPEVLDELQSSRYVDSVRGFTLFFTGLSGAGKSTIAQALHTRLLEIQHRPITYLDGDIIRQHLSKGLGFSKEDRNTNVQRIGFVAAEVVRHGGIALCAAIAPYAQSRDYNRELISTYGVYIEVHVATPLAVCKQRDVKGLYSKAEAGLIQNVTGIDDPYEEPDSAEISIDTSETSVTEAVDMVCDYLKQQGLL